MEKDINYCHKKVIADGKSDVFSVVRNLRITATGVNIPSGFRWKGAKDDGV